MLAPGRSSYSIGALLLATGLGLGMSEGFQGERGEDHRMVAATPEDLIELEEILVRVCPPAVEATVGLRILDDGGMPLGDGSGVIIDPEGLVLTVAHNLRAPGVDLIAVLHDGRQVRARALGRNSEGDFGLVRLLEEGPWPHAPMGTTTELVEGEALITLGHPGGSHAGRPPVVRLGRFFGVVDGAEGQPEGQWVRHSGKIMPGDSGGPLFDLRGRVVGIHTWIQVDESENYAVPVERYGENWSRLLASESWGEGGPGASAPGGPARPSGPRRWRKIEQVGIRMERGEGAELRIEKVEADSLAAKAGLRSGDRILSIEGEILEATRTFDRRLGSKIRRRAIEVELEVERDGETVEVLLPLEEDES